MGGLSEMVEANSGKKGGLKAFVKENSAKITIADGETFTGLLKGYSTGIDPRDASKKVINYVFNADGKDKILTSASLRLASEMGRVEDTVGFPVKVSITRTGVSYETRYQVKVVE